jgi:hypothetical protein
MIGELVAEIRRVKVRWEGFPGGPGLGTHYLSETTVAYPALVNFYSVIKSRILINTTLHIESGGDIIDDSNGELTGTWGTPSDNPIVGTGTGDYAGPVGMMINWSTGVIRDGHRLRGKTFLVPCSPLVFDGNGGVDVVDRTSINTQITNALTSMAGGLVIWHRPKFAKVEAPGTGTAVVRPGSSAPVTAGSISAKAVVLRSRRD